MSKPESYDNSPQDLRDTARQLIESFGSDLSMLEGAMVAALARAAKNAKAEERESVAAWHMAECRKFETMAKGWSSHGGGPKNAESCIATASVHKTSAAAILSRT